MKGNEIQRHKAADKVKWIVAAIAFFMIAVLLVGVCMQLWAPDKYKPSEWGNQGEEQTGKLPTTDENGGMVTDGTIDEHGISVCVVNIPVAQYDAYGILPIAESAKQLTATIEPVGATDATVDWSVAWKDAGSSWAKSKTVTDYVTITPTTKGGLVANAQCLQAFGEQIIITVRSRDNSDAYATCTVDYVKKINADERLHKCQSRINHPAKMGRQSLLKMFQSVTRTGAHLKHRIDIYL